MKKHNTTLSTPRPLTSRTSRNRLGLLLALKFPFRILFDVIYLVELLALFVLVNLLHLVIGGKSRRDRFELRLRLGLGRRGGGRVGLDDAFRAAGSSDGTRRHGAGSPGRGGSRSCGVVVLLYSGGGGRRR
jgi:hypothetical protein